MAKQQPIVIVIGGPNGAGKSTIAPTVLDEYLDVDDFVNADAIARGLSAFNPEHVAFEAGRIMLAELKRLAAARKSFAFESTLASRSFAPWIERLRKDCGYHFVLVYVWVKSPELAVNRVVSRVRSGGHLVPEDVIRRRWQRSLDNLFKLYMPLADRWRVFNNGDVGPEIVAEGGRGRELTAGDPVLWSVMQERRS